MPATFTLQQFNELPRPYQYGALETYGVYLDAYRIAGPYKIALFSLYGFYVQVWYNQVTDRLIRCSAFDDYEKLDQFLECIDLAPLYCML